MWIGNLMLVVLNLPLIGLWVKLLTVPYYVLFPIIMAFCSIGVYSVNTNVFDLYAVAFFGLTKTRRCPYWAGSRPSASGVQNVIADIQWTRSSVQLLLWHESDPGRGIGTT